MHIRGIESSIFVPDSVLVRTFVWVIPSIEKKKRSRLRDEELGNRQVYHSSNPDGSLFLYKLLLYPCFRCFSVSIVVLEMMLHCVFRVFCCVFCRLLIVAFQKKRSSPAADACWLACVTVTCMRTYVRSLFDSRLPFVCWLFGNFLKNSGNWRCLHDNFWEPVGKFCEIDG